MPGVRERVNIVVIGYVDSGKPAAVADASENVSADASQVTELYTRGPIYKISYDLSYDYRKFIVKSTYDSDLKRAEISLRNICDDITILHVNRTYEKPSVHCKMFCKLDVCRKSIATLALSYDNRKTVVRYFVNRAPGRGAYRCRVVWNTYITWSVAS